MVQNTVGKQARQTESLGSFPARNAKQLVPAKKRATDVILVVDDDVGVRESLGCLLQTAGYRVHEAANGKSAIAVTRSNSVDLIVIDIIMPVKEGIETISDVKRSHPDIKIIAISGKPDYLRWADRLGADRTFGKPFDTDDFLSTVESLLEAA